MEQPLMSHNHGHMTSMGLMNIPICWKCQDGLQIYLVDRINLNRSLKQYTSSYIAKKLEDDQAS